MLIYIADRDYIESNEPDIDPVDLPTQGMAFPVYVRDGQDIADVAKQIQALLDKNP